MGPGAVSPLRGISQITTVLWVSGSEPYWFWKLAVSGACLSRAGLKNWSIQCEVWALRSLGRSSGFWDPPSYELPFWVGLMVSETVSQTPLAALLRFSSHFHLSPGQTLNCWGWNCSTCSSRLSGFIGGEFRIFLNCCLELEPPFLWCAARGRKWLSHLEALGRGYFWSFTFLMYQTPLVSKHGLFTWEHDSFLLTSENCGINILLPFLI